MDSSVDDETLLIVRCVGLNLSGKTTFKNVGVLSNIFLLATGSKTATNEKRTIKLSQSAPFRLGGRPPNSDPTQFYVSETIDDLSDVSPSLLAPVRCPMDLDCTIRLSVYYSSNLTGEKDVLLAGTSFNRKEVLRAVQSKGVFISDMISEYCPGSKAFIELVPHFPNVLPDVATIFPSRLPEAVRQAEENYLGFNITSRKYSGNPFKQRYVFYAEQDPYRPLVVAEESTWEPRFSALIPALFMENFTAALMRSINAWNMRYELERKRQGRFRSLKEAIQHGWHSVNVTVMEARIGSTRAQKERLRQQQLQQELQAQAAAAAAEGVPAGNAPGNRSSSRYASSSGSRQASLAAGAGGGGGSNAPLPVYNVCIPFPSSCGEGAEGALQGPKIEVAEGYVRGGRKVLVDETAPCTFVEVSLHDPAQTFTMPLGRTNTEHYTLNPVYGTNLHQPQGSRKGSLVPLAGADCVEICFAERSCHFYSYDTTDRDAVTRWFHQQRQLTRASVVAEKSTGVATTEGAEGSCASTSTSSSHSNSGGRNGADTPQQRHLSATLQSVLPLPPADSVLTMSAKEAHFYRFVASCTDVKAVFDVYFDDPHSGQRKKVGSCSLPLRAGCQVDTWLPVTRDPGVDGDLLEDVEVRVVLSVKSPFEEGHQQQQQQTGERSTSQDSMSGRDYFTSKPSPAAMPEVLAFQRSIQGSPEKDGIFADLSRSRSLSADAAMEGGRPTTWSTLSDEQMTELGDYRSTLANAYEWMWYAGFNGLDPLVVDAAAAGPEKGQTKGAASDVKKRSSSSNDVAPRGAAAPVTVTSVIAPEARSTSTSPLPDVKDGGYEKGRGSEDHGENRADDEVEDFDEHFHSTRMSVFESAPPPAPHVDDAFPLTGDQLNQHLAVGAAGASATAATVFDGMLQADDLLTGDATPPAPTPTVGIEAAQENAISDVEGATAASSESAQDASLHPAPSRRVRYVKRSRVDFPYPLEWIRAHVEAMQALAVELGSLVPLLKQAHKEDKGFRASPFKKQPEWQALPINLHYQLMAVRPFTSSPAMEVRTEVVHSVTCGSMSPHMLGHKNGGLYFQESKLVASKMELERAKMAYTQRVAMAGSRCISTASTEPYGIHKRLCEIGDRALKFETMCLGICHRRAYAISQALSIAVNSLLLKLGLALQGGIPDRVCDQWLTCGVLLVFEGLLSVVAHERSMLEDTISAVDALRSFQVRLLPYPDEPRQEPGKGYSGNGVTSPAVAEGAAAVNEADAGTPEAQNSPDGSRPPSQPSAAGDPVHGAADPAASEKRTLKLELKGREVLVFVPRSSLRRMSDSYQNAAYSQGGAVIPFNPVLFTQGIDIQQTMVSTFGGDTSKGRTNNLHLQHDVNLKGLRDINAYCLKALPVTSDMRTVRVTSTGKGGIGGGAAGTGATEPVNAEGLSAERKAAVSAQLLTHPLVKPLQETILSSSLTLKNVDLLIEVERLALMLGGCRITFCKSGKDRTGMACTLEQSRQLGERYGCGMAVPRILRDANLMRLHGTRLLIAEKNIGRKVYSINKLQAQFLPAMFRPPNAVCEDMMKKDNS